MNGYTGKILKVDLTNRSFETEEPGPDFYRRYFGGNGFIAYYLLKEMPAGADPLGPDNLLIFAGGTMTGIPIAGAGRSAVGGKSPLTGGYGESDVGGYFGAEFRRAGFDAMVVRGKASSPVYIWIKDGEVEIKPADHLWGMTTLECQETVRTEVGEKAARLATIGPGGEKMVRFACVINDVNRAAGRTGLGAVMGSKNLKCVAARGRTTVPVADEDALKALSRYMVQHWRDRQEGMHELGTAGGLVGLNAMGALPTRNFQDGQFEGAEKITGATMRDTILIDRDGCFACPIRCKRVVEVKEGDYQVNPTYGGPEYETLGAFGSCCGIDDLPAIAKANELCNAYGLDTISTGMTIAFAMECFENGLLTEDDTGGLDLSFGNAEAMVELTRRIGEREGLGDLLAEGATRAAEKIGPGAEAFNISVKGSPFPMHECRVRHGQGLGYAMSPTGADHMHNTWADAPQANDPVPEDLQALGVYVPVPATELNAHKVRAYTFMVQWRWVSNHICCCMFIPWSRDQIIDIVRAITGWQTNLWELLKMTERGLTMARSFNLREGLTRDNDVLPARMATSHKSGSLNEKPITPEALRSAVSAYYGMMGWDPETGEPSAAKLDELDIAWVKEYR